MDKPTPTSIEDELGGQEEVDMNVEDMDKMRSGSISPSALSTASSGSPLVRGNSSSSTHRGLAASTALAIRARPALRPTSIAAAQLECQQRQRVEFSNPRLAHNGYLPDEKQATGKQSAATAAFKSNKKQAEKEAKAADGQQQQDANKGLAYRLAKSLAFRAYRFNEFWSVNKLRYMNLVCLLLTLLCLVTILTFSGKSGSNNGNSGVNNGNVVVGGEQKQQQQPTNGRKALGSNDDSSQLQPAESIDSLDSQALRQQPDEQFDDFSLLTSGEQPERRAGKFKRKSSEESAGALQNRLSAIEREFGSTATELPGADSANAAAASADASNASQEPTTTPAAAPATSAAAPGSLVEPILGQLFNDMELGSFIRAAIKRAGNATLNGKPLVRRTKNGATIIISSSTFNDSNNALNNETSSSPFAPSLSLPSLLDKLLPPMFRPTFPLAPMRPTVIESGANGLTIASIGGSSVMGEPMLSASGSFPSRFSPFSSGAQLELPSLSFAGRTRHVSSPLFLPEPLGFRSSFGPPPQLLGGGGGFGSAPMPFGLLGMMMRASSIQPPAGLIGELIESDEAPPMVVQFEPSSAGRHQQPASNATTTTTLTTSAAKNDTLQAQATSQQGVSAAGNATQLKETEEKLGGAANEQSQESPAKQNLLHHHHQNRHLQSLYSRPRGSMLIVSSSLSPNALLDPFQPLGSALPPFMAVAPPNAQVMQFTMGGNEAAGSGALNPILRSILSNVMSDMSPSAAAAAESGARNTSVQKDKWSVGNGEPANDDDWPVSSEVERSWDEQPTFGAGSSKQLKARHRALISSNGGEDELEGSGDQQEASQPPPQMVSLLDRQFESGLLSGTIRQTIRGPGMSVERIIEVPTSPSRHLRSGSSHHQLSNRADSMMMMMEDEGESERVPSLTSRIDEPFPVGSISKLLADMRRPTLVQSGDADQQQHNHQPPSIKNRSSMNDDDESTAEEGGEALQGNVEHIISSSSAQSSSNRPLWSPKIRLASARISMSRPTIAMLAAEQRSASSSAPETAILMPPPSAPMHFTIPAPDNNISNNEAEQQQQQGNENRLSSFEDTLNSIEDRLNHVLSIASSPQQSGNGAQDNNNNKPTRASHSREKQIASAASETAQPQSSAPMAYTSPTSPLFGFPAQPHQQLQQQPASGNRQPRSSFTYHSNHELANQAPKPHEPEAPRPRSFMGPFLGPPASSVMGRRLDDGPAISAQ